MRKAHVLVNGIMAGILEQLNEHKYKFIYDPAYHGTPVSLTMPIEKSTYEFNNFPPFFEGLLPEGAMLEALLRRYKIDRDNYFEQLIRVGQDVVGAVTIENLE